MLKQHLKPKMDQKKDFLISEFRGLLRDANILLFWRKPNNIR